jgi:hypothetical protein
MIEVFVKVVTFASSGTKNPRHPISSPNEDKELTNIPRVAEITKNSKSKLRWKPPHLKAQIIK